MLQRMADPVAQRFGQRRKRILFQHRDLEHHSGEFLRFRLLLSWRDPRRTFDQSGRNVASCDRRTMYPRRESRVAFEYPELVLGVADHLQLSATGPFHFPYRRAERYKEILIDLRDIT